jgi:3-oxoacyl-[acyl-carrier protein] reductase
MKLEGKAALVTGGGTGVGRATSLALAEHGCRVLVNYSRSEDAAEEVAELVRNRGVEGVAMRGDVARDDDCRALVEKAVGSFGRLDVLVNNAGTTTFVPHNELDRITDDDWEHIMAVNLKGPFQCARAARTALEADGGGEVVNLSSVAGVIGTGSSIPYCASKAGLNILTVILARVMGPHVRVNAVAPGFIDGSWLRSGLGPAYEAIKSAMESRSPLGKVSTPEDVRDAILSLIEGSDLVTGQVLLCDGGMSIAG